MPDADESRDKQEAEDRQRAGMAIEVEREERKRCCGEDRTQRDVSGEREDDEEDAEDAEACLWDERNKDAEAADDSFAAVKSQPDREDVADHRCYRRSNGEVIVAGRKMLGEFNCRVSLCDVQKQSRQTKALGPRTRDVRSSNIAAARRANIFLAKNLDEQIAEGNRAEEVGNRDCDEPVINERAGVPNQCTN